MLELDLDASGQDRPVLQKRGGKGCAQLRRELEPRVLEAAPERVARPVAARVFVEEAEGAEAGTGEGTRVEPSQVLRATPRLALHKSHQKKREERAPILQHHERPPRGLAESRQNEAHSIGPEKGG